MTLKLLKILEMINNSMSLKHSIWMNRTRSQDIEFSLVDI